MLNQPPLDQLLPKTENRYTLAVLVAKRARQLVDGAQPMVDSESPNLVTLASEEVAASTVVGVPGEHNPTIPIRPEIEAARMAAERDLDNDMTFDLLQQVQPVQPEPEPEEQPRASLIKILGEDGEVYEQEDADDESASLDDVTPEVGEIDAETFRDRTEEGVSTSLIEGDVSVDDGSAPAADPELDDDTPVSDEGTLRESPVSDDYDDESDAEAGLDEEAEEDLDNLEDSSEDA